MQAEARVSAAEDHKKEYQVLMEKMQKENQVLRANQIKAQEKARKPG